MGKYGFDEVIDRRGTFCEKWDGQGGEYLAMWVADMDFRSPEPVISAMRRRVEDGVFGYTENEWVLNEVVVSYYREHHGCVVEPEWIVWTGGVMPGVNLACRMEGGDILFQTPMYPHIRTVSMEVHKERIEVPLKLWNGRYGLDREGLEAAVTPETTSFILCNPHNPVGRVYTREELVWVSDFCKRHELLLISDEIHSQLVLEGKHIPAFSIDEEARMNSITFTSAAKTYNIPSLALAFAIIPNPRIRERFRDAAGGLIPSANPITIAAVKAAYTECEEWRRELLCYIKGNRECLADWAARTPGVHMMPMEATYLAWLDMRELEIPDVWRYLREKAGVNFSNGADFGQEGFIRVNLGCSRILLKQVLDKVSAALV